MATLLVAGLVFAGLAAVFGGDDGGDPAPPPAPATTEAERPPSEALRPGAEGLDVGLFEGNANLLWADERGGAFEPWRARVEALRPRWYRLLVDWSQLQPERDGPFLFDKRNDGCLRERPPCREFGGMRDVLRAVRSQQREHGGWEVVATILGVPEWAARAPGGCERSTELPRARPITRAGLEGYRGMVRAVLGLAAEEGVAIRWWSPWNEANHPAFVSPQRARCDAGAPSRAPRTYSRLLRALRAELAAHPGDHRLVLGELAAASGPKPLVTGVTEFVRALPDADACAGDVWAQHQYAERDPEGGSSLSGDARDAVTELRRALDERDCTRGKPIWVTETGVGGAHVGAKRSRSRSELFADCFAMERTLRRWQRDPRVDAAFQFSLREDVAFPVGVFDTALEREYPVYELWLALARGQLRASPCR